MSLRSCLFLFLGMLLVVSCRQAGKAVSRGRLQGLWFFEIGGMEDYSSRAYLDLRPEGYTCYLPDYFDYGNWKLDEAHRIIRLHSQRHPKIYGDWSLKLDGFSGEEAIVQLPEARRFSQIHFLNEAARREMITMILPEQMRLRKAPVQSTGSAAEDPFSLQNSRWRICAYRREDCALLRQRASNIIHHFILLFGAYSRSGTETVSWERSPNPFQFGSNGIALQLRDEVDRGWLHTFYDDKDETVAYWQLEHFFRQKITFPPHAPKYTDMWVSLLQQMEREADGKDWCAEDAARISDLMDTTAKRKDRLNRR